MKASTLRLHSVVAEVWLYIWADLDFKGTQPFEVIRAVRVNFLRFTDGFIVMSVATGVWRQAIF